jgi:prevent-host-death family protein
MTITASEFKAKCLRLMDQVFKTGEPISITKRGIEVARLSPPRPKLKPWEELRGRGVLLASPEESFFEETDFDAFTGRELEHRRRARNKRKKR